MIASYLRFALAALAFAWASAHAADAADPFRALERSGDPATQSFFRDQAQHTRHALDALPGHAALAARIRELSDAQTSITHVVLAAGRVFYLKTGAGEAVASLCMREGFGGAERVLVDPQHRPAGEAPTTIDWFVPAPDGRHVAYGLSRGGSEDSVLRVMVADTARDLPFEIDRARFNAELAWEPDARAFYYARVPEGNAVGPAGDAHVRIYRHVLGRESGRDELVFASGVGGARDISEIAVPALVVPPQSHYAIAVVRDGVRPEIGVQVTDQRDLAKGHPRWHKLFGPEAGVIAVQAWHDELYLLTKHDAPRHRVLRVKASAPSLSAARVAVPQGDSVITAIGLAHDALYLRTMVGGTDRLERAPLGLLGAHAPEYVRTPFDMAITQLITDPRRIGAILCLDGWMDAPAVVEVDHDGELHDTHLQPPSTVDFSGIDQVRLYAPATDGTRIPVTLVYRKTTRLTSENPTLLLGFGAYGAVPQPHYDAARMAWLERGGVFAVAHVRGGGEYGEAWREAARGPTKTTTILDFIAVSRFLASYGFTNPKRLAIEGTGAGAIAVGGALVREPQLFAAVILRAPWLDLLRFEQAPGGPAQVPEFGSAANAQGRDALAAVSPYAQVRGPMPYPGVLLSVGMNDPRVAPWQAAKMAARLQAATASGRPVLLRVDYASGMGFGTPRSLHDAELADIYAFALWQFGDRAFQPVAAQPPTPTASAPKPG